MPPSEIRTVDDPGISLSERAYRSIRDAILSNQLRVGEHIREEWLAKQLGMSRTPVREALGRLRAENLLDEARPRGFVVAGVTTSDVIHVYAVREELEAFSARLAAGRITPHELFRLSTIVDRMEQSLDDTEHYSNLNREFHVLIHEATGNPVLAKIMDDLMAAVERFPVSAYAIEGRAERALEEHRRLLRTLEEHDAEAAESAIREHLKVGVEARLAALRHHAVGETADGRAQAQVEAGRASDD